MAKVSIRDKKELKIYKSKRYRYPLRFLRSTYGLCAIARHHRIRRAAFRGRARPCRVHPYDGNFCELLCHEGLPELADAADGDKIPDAVPPAAADGDAAAKKTRDDFVIQFGLNKESPDAHFTRQHKQVLASLKIAASGNDDLSEVLRDKTLTVQAALEELTKASAGSLKLSVT